MQEYTYLPWFTAEVSFHLLSDARLNPLWGGRNESAEAVARCFEVAVTPACSSHAEAEMPPRLRDERALTKGSSCAQFSSESCWRLALYQIMWHMEILHEALRSEFNLNSYNSVISTHKMIIGKNIGMKGAGDMYLSKECKFFLKIFILLMQYKFV